VFIGPSPFFNGHRGPGRQRVLLPYPKSLDTDSSSALPTMVVIRQLPGTGHEADGDHPPRWNEKAGSLGCDKLPVNALEVQRKRHEEA
jgi:hypothetical protein